MSLNNQPATATVSVLGLALSCYNRATNNWEVGFIRHPRHKLMVEVKANFQGEPSVSTFEIDANHKIEIDVVKGILPDEPIFQVGENFDRTATGNHEQDFRWIVDLERELNGNEPVTLKVPEFPITEMFVRQPVLYADTENVILGNTQLINVADPDDKRVFGRLSEGIMADINCEEGGGVILKLVGPMGFKMTLPHVPGGEPHTISFNNTCPPPLVPTPNPAPANDFTLYYSVIVDTDGKKFDLQKEEQAMGGLVPDAICNPGNTGVRDKLFPLPTA